ncbi:MAG: nicotinate-nucleotide--dimethylbenzimidazole phosphoribosyltransferase [Candidatus Acidiferrales bacterium]
MTSCFELQSFLTTIAPADESWIRRAQERQDRLTKPPGSLGRLEEIANRICAMQRTLEPRTDNPAILIFAADHRVCDERVNPFPQSVTRQMLANFLAEGAAINALAKSAGATLTVVDVGVLGSPLEDAKLLTRRIRAGARNFCREPAMSEEEAIAAIGAGIQTADEAVRSGSTLLAIGEMGIGNSTVASAVCAAITKAEPAAVCGRGTGSDDAGLARKRDVVARALALHHQHLTTPLDVVARLGGFEIAAMCGACLSAAHHRVPLIVDGFISAAAAAIAVLINEAVRDYLIAAHQSTEPGHRAFLDFLQLEPLLQLKMRLGEGTGAALAIPIVRAAVAAFRSMKTFESAGVAESIVKTTG